MTPTLSSRGRALVTEIAGRHGVSEDAAFAVLQALQQSGGGMAQFNHPDLGGSGQWMAGGMTMVGDMFNHGLKARVDGLCSDLAALLSSQATGSAGQFQMQRQDGEPLWEIPSSPAASFIGSGVGQSADWPDFGPSDWQGSQNDMRYAYYAAAHRLVVAVGGKISVYDTGGIPLQGVSQQQQNSFSTLSFTTPSGPLPLSALRLVEDGKPPSAAREPQQPVTSASAAGPSMESGGGGGLPGAEELNGTSWVLAPDSAPLTFMADGTVTGDLSQRARYWASEADGLRLFAEDGSVTAYFDHARRDGAQRLVALSRTGRPEQTLIPAGVTAETASLDGRLSLTIDLTAGDWALFTAGDVELCRLRLLPDRRIEGGRGKESRWRLNGTTLLFLHPSGRPTIRFDSVHFQAGCWRLGGTFLGDGTAACDLRQV